LLQKLSFTVAMFLQRESGEYRRSRWATEKHCRRKDRIKCLSVSAASIDRRKCLSWDYAHYRHSDERARHSREVAGAFQAMSIMCIIPPTNIFVCQLDAAETLKQFDRSFPRQCFRSPTEICRYSPDSRWRTSATVNDSFWSNNYRLTGDNSRERPYTNLLGRLDHQVQRLCGAHARAGA